jgi:hypothetical protein
LRVPELKALLADAQAGVEARLPKRVRAVLALPAGERDKLIADRKKLLAAKAKTKSRRPAKS